jgi:hypothetical protein
MGSLASCITHRSWSRRCRCRRCRSSGAPEAAASAGPSPALLPWSSAARHAPPSAPPGTACSQAHGIIVIVRCAVPVNEHDSMPTNLADRYNLAPRMSGRITRIMIQCCIATAVQHVMMLLCRHRLGRPENRRGPDSPECRHLDHHVLLLPPPLLDGRAVQRVMRLLQLTLQSTRPRSWIDE